MVIIKLLKEIINYNAQYLKFGMSELKLSYILIIIFLIKKQVIQFKKLI